MTQTTDGQTRRDPTTETARGVQPRPTLQELRAYMDYLDWAYGADDQVDPEQALVDSWRHMQGARGWR